MTPEDFRRHGHAVVDLMAGYLEALPTGPPWTPVPPATRAALRDQELADGGTPFEELIAFVEDNVLPHPFGNGHPRFFGWANPPPALEGVLAELVATAMNPSCAGGDQAAVHLENLVVGWLAQLIGYPGGGVLVSGGSAGALTALAAARHRAALADGWDDRVEGMGGKRAADLRLYVSDEGHSSLRKAAQLLGFGDNGVRIMPTDRAGRLLIEPLAAAVEGDRAGGRRPFCVVASAGVVGTGVIDPLADVAELCRRNGMWFHVDGSLGGFGVLDPGVRSRFRGMEAADSVVLDPHKWLSVPIDCAALLVGQLDDLRSTFSLVPSYVRSREGDEPWFSEYVFDQTRPFRALKLWATMAAAGRDELGARIGRSIARARRLAGQVTAAPELELLAEPELCVVAFRLASASDETNRRLPEVVQRMGDVFLTGAKVDGREAIRACFMHDATTDADVDRIVPAVLAAARSMTEGPLSP